MKAHLLRLLIFSLLISASLCASAQRSGTVYLKNGSIIRGDITTGSDNGVLVATPEGRLYTYRRNEVRDIRYKRQIGPTPGHRGGRFVELWDANEIEIGVGYGTGIGKNGSNITSIAAIAYSYRAIPNLSFGGRFDFDQIASVERWYMSFVANVKGYLGPATGTQPFLSIDGGYAKGLKNGTYDDNTGTGGWLVTPSVGMAIRLGRHTGLHLYLGYRMQWIPEFLFIGGRSKAPVRVETVMMRMAFTLYIPR